MLLCCGCSAQRAQQAADTRAGIHAAEIAAKAGDCNKVLAILPGADARLSAVAEVPSADFPAPAMTVEAIGIDPQHYITSAPPEAKGWGVKAWALAGTVGMFALYGLKILAPMIPGGGPLVAGVANTAWDILAHKDQRAADAAASQIVGAASAIVPLIQAAKGDSRFTQYITPQVEAIAATLAKPPA